MRWPALILVALAAMGGAGSLSADAPSAFAPYTTADGARVPGIVILCPKAGGALVAPCGSADSPLSTLGMPFQRTGDPVMLAATPSPQQYAITQPPDTKSYRGVNPCAVDIRIKTVASMAETVTTSTGTRFLARTAETLASSPAMTSPRIVSIMTVGDPGAGGCTFELGYGNGG